MLKHEVLANATSVIKEWRGSNLREHFQICPKIHFFQLFFFLLILRSEERIDAQKSVKVGVLMSLGQIGKVAPWKSWEWNILLFLALLFHFYLSNKLEKLLPGSHGNGTFF